MKVKLISLMSVTLLMTLAVSAQTVTRESPIGKTDVPKPVLKAFKSAYPQASARSYMKVEVNGVPFYRIASLEKESLTLLSFFAKDRQDPNPRHRRCKSEVKAQSST